MKTLPFVSVIMPVRNEEAFIRRSVSAVLNQDYPADRYEVLVVDGMSTDNTPAIVQDLIDNRRPGASTLAPGDPAAVAGAEQRRPGPRLVLLENPAFIVPPAMNLGLRQSKGEVIIRVDGHCEISPDYISRCVEALERTGAECVGGPMLTRGQTYIAQTIAVAQSSWFGVGGVAFRTGRKAPGFVDTVAFGAYRRDVFERIGVFDEELVRNQDDEFNFRLVQSGGRIWLDPAIRCVYYSRANLSRLWRQYYQYGFYKVLVFKKRGKIASWRHLVPAMFVTALLATLFLNLFTHYKLWGLPVLLPYVCATLIASLLASRPNPRVITLLPAVFVILHVSYGLGFLLGIWRWLIMDRSKPKHPRYTPAGEPIPATVTPRRLTIGILTQYYPPEIGAPQVRLSEMAKRFCRRGHRVVVLTAMPNYPTGHLYPGYRGFYRREERDGVTVLRTAIYPTKSVSMIPRLSNYLSFMLASFFVGLVKLPRMDYLVTESPPLFLGITGYLLAKVKRSRWIFNVSDLWPDSAVHLGVLRKRVNFRLARRLEAFLYQTSWLVTGQSHETLENIQQRFPQVRVHGLSNGVDLTKFSPQQRSVDGRTRIEPVGGDGVIAIYAGLHGIAQGLEQILQAAALLTDLPQLRFVFVGDGPEKEKLIEVSRTLGLRNVRFLDPVPPETVPSLIASAEIGLVPLKVRLPGAIPSKLYEIMACALPAIIVAQGEPAAIVEEASAGIAVKPGDTAALVAALRALVADPVKRRQYGENGRRTVMARFNREVILRDFVAYLEGESLAAPPLSTRPEETLVPVPKAAGR